MVYTCISAPGACKESFHLTRRAPVRGAPARRCVWRQPQWRHPGLLLPGSGGETSLARGTLRPNHCLFLGMRQGTDMLGRGA